MKNTKTNNLFAFGKKTALLAMFAVLPFTKANAYDERAYMSPSEQYEYQTNGDLPSDIESKKEDSKGGYVALGILIAICIPVWIDRYIYSKKHPEQWKEMQKTYVKSH